MNIFFPANRKYIMWAEPDEGSYNWKLLDLGSRYERFDINSIPIEVKDMIKNKADFTYPIVIIDGFHIDSLLDIRDNLDSGHIIVLKKEDLN